MNWHLLIMLESALKASPSNHHFKLLLMKVYCSMGKLAPSWKKKSYYNSSDVCSVFVRSKNGGFLSSDEPNPTPTLLSKDEEK